MPTEPTSLEQIERWIERRQPPETSEDGWYRLPLSEEHKRLIAVLKHTTDTFSIILEAPPNRSPWIEMFLDAILAILNGETEKRNAG